MSSAWNTPGPTLGEMIVGHATAPPPAAPPPPPPLDIPTDAGAAASKLNELKQDATWRDAFLKGNAREVGEFKALSEKVASSDNPAVDKAMAGLLEDGPFQDGKHMRMIAGAEWLRAANIGDEVVRQVLAGEPVSKEEHATATAAKARLMADHAFAQRYLAGDGEAKRQMTLLNIITASRIKAAA